MAREPDLEPRMMAFSLLRKQELVMMNFGGRVNKHLSCSNVK